MCEDIVDRIVPPGSHHVFGSFSGSLFRHRLTESEKIVTFSQIKKAIKLFFYYFLQSLPTRGAWIEILYPRFLYCPQAVAPHAGSVD